MHYKIPLALSLVLLGSCGTLNTIHVENNEVGINHSQVKTNCEEITRIYSGVQYNLCILDSERKNTPPKFQLDPLWLTSIDLLLSSVADTLLLPVTIFQQAESGNIKVVR